MSLLLSVHLLSAGVWAGCVATEVAFERRLAAAGRQGELAALHRTVDLAVELPALLLVAGSGLALAWGWPIEGLLAVKIGFGALAVLANAGCIVVVLRRDTAWRAGQRAVHARLDRLQHRLGTLVVLGLAGAVATGLWRLAGT